MAYQDVRQFLKALEDNGELIHVSPKVDLKYEVGAICRKVADARGPALWFENPGDCEASLVVNTFGTRERVALALGTTVDKLHEEWATRPSDAISPATVLTEDAPCKEVIVSGGDVDLSAIPVPTWNPGDGGAFFTLALCFSHDPETGTRNVGLYRNQVQSQNTVGLFAHPFRHVMLQAKSVLEAGEPFPVALVAGVDPTIVMASIADLPYGADEMALAASLRRAPVEMVRCETIPVEVPATAEYVIEGEIVPGGDQDEGPFGEVTGYYGLRKPAPLVQVKAITHRRNPIHVACHLGRPPTEDHVMGSIRVEVELLRTVPLPGIKRVHVRESACGTMACVVSIRKAFEGHGRMMGLSVLSGWAGYPIKTVIVVDEDIDPSDWGQVEWAIATRFQPARDLEVITSINGHPLDPSIEEVERQRGTALTSKMILDATRFDAAHYEKECQPDPATFQRVKDEWEKYGIPLRQW